MAEAKVPPEQSHPPKGRVQDLALFLEGGASAPCPATPGKLPGWHEMAVSGAMAE